MSDLLCQMCSRPSEQAQRRKLGPGVRQCLGGRASQTGLGDLATELPDVRVQYETRTAERAWLGLEYVSVHYGGGDSSSARSAHPTKPPTQGLGAT